MSVPDESCCEVSRSDCEACLESTRGSNRFVSTDFASLLHRACSNYLSSRHLDKAASDHVRDLMAQTEKAIVDDALSPSSETVSCDVFVACDNATELTKKSIESVLEQQHANVTLHLIVTDSLRGPLMESFASQLNVHIHPMADQNVFAAVHRLVTRVDSEFIALHHPEAISHPDRIANSVKELQRSGAVLLGSAMVADGTLVKSVESSRVYEASVPWPTLVFRRDTYVDVGGFAARDSDIDVEFVHRVRQSGGRVVAILDALVKLAEPWNASLLGPEPDYVPAFGSLRKYGMGFPMQSVDCDIVLPIHGQLKYVSESIKSVVDQTQATTTVHLVDDASPESTTDLFRYWGTHPRIRLYRNHQNIGQFMSFNNVSEYFETELVAVQDGDDISLPHRITESGNLLRLCSADYYAAAMKQFGVEEIPNDRRIRRSFRPPDNGHLYFAMNPTACFRVDLFRRLRGYADFGSVERNCTGLDSEFMIRALCAPARFVLSSLIVSRHRLHENSATRNSETGFGSPARDFALKECRRRLNLFCGKRFDPRAFGSLGRYRELTERI